MELIKKRIHANHISNALKSKYIPSEHRRPKRKIDHCQQINIERASGKCDWISCFCDIRFDSKQFNIKSEIILKHHRFVDQLHGMKTATVKWKQKPNRTNNHWWHVFIFKRFSFGLFEIRQNWMFHRLRILLYVNGCEVNSEWFPCWIFRYFRWRNQLGKTIC